MALVVNFGEEPNADDEDDEESGRRLATTTGTPELREERGG